MSKIIWAAILLSVLGMTGCDKVPAGHVGVKAYLLGSSKGVDTEELGPGRYWIGMNEELYIFPTFTQNWTWEKRESISFQTKEGLTVSADMGISYYIDPKRVSDIFQKYRKGIEEITDIYLRNMVRDALVQVASTRPVEAVYGEGKAEILEKATELVVAQVKPLGIMVEKLYWVGQLNLPDPVISSINAKIQATQIAQQRENEVATAKAEAQKKVAEAQGQADSLLLVAEAESKSIRLKGEALRDNPKLVEWKAVEKWNGELPQVSGGATPFIDLRAK